MSMAKTKLGMWLGRWLDSWPAMADWKDSERVWRFQERFGVRKTAVPDAPKSAPSDSFVCLDEDAIVSNSKRKSPNSPGVRRRSRRLAEAAAASLSNDQSPPAAATASAGGSSLAESSLVSSSGYSSGVNYDCDCDTEGKNVVRYRITDQFWYWIFFLGTQLGDETYYSIFFSFWFWNIDGAVGRRIILVWNVVMYIGQGMKDIIRWPRPRVPTVVQLESKWALEYGMPSTHAMIGLAVPMGILYFTVGRYEYPFLLWALIAFNWCTLVCTSRLYLGMHSYADIYVGLAFSSFLLCFVLPFVEYSDNLLMSSPWAPLVTVALSLAAIVFYPGSDRWTPARGDTTVVLGSYLGVHLGVWFNYHMGLLRGPPLPPPYPILWPTYEQFVQTLLRMAVGAVILVATRAMAKPATWHLASLIMGEDAKELKRQPNHIENKNKIRAELAAKFFPYICMGFNSMVVCPVAFQVMGIERSTFYTEI